MKANSVKSELWRLILLPAISITLLLSATLTLLYMSALDRFIDQRGRLLAEKTAHLAHIAIRNHNPQMLQQVLQSTLEEPMIRAIHVDDHEQQQSQHFGPRFLEITQKAPSREDLAQIAYSDYTARFSYPIVNDQGEDPVGKLEIELALSSYWVTIYQTLLIVVLATTACLLLAGYFAVKLHGNIVRPANIINAAIGKLSAGQLDTRIEGEFAYEFQQLAQNVNTMASIQEHAQQDMQQHIEQSMDDLRETLETIEIQNIELDIARKEAVAASQIKSEFLANTSHEIRTPLNGIIGFTNLAMKTPLNDKQRSYVQTIHDSAQNLLTIINDILDFSKIESGKIVLDYIPLALRQVVESSVDTLAYEAQEKNLQILTIIDNNIPPQLMGDPLRFSQIITNLLGNAVKFSNKGTIIIELSLERFEENRVTLKGAVTDEGIGLNEEQQRELFSAFTQADTSVSREYGGTGLGLAICKGLVNRMNGSVGVDSAPDKGATFWFTVELGVDPHFAATEYHYLQNKRLLISSDIEAGYRQLASLTESWGAQTSWIQSVHDIFTTLRGEQQSGQSYDLILLDVSPGERRLPLGLLDNLAEQLESEFGCKLIICCTAGHKMLFAQHASSSTIEFVTKPITQAHLLQACGHAMNMDLENGDEPATGEQPEQYHVLLVDDNEANLQLASEFLQDLNVRVTQAKSGEQALQMYTDGAFDLVFMDIQMPGMDGMQTTQEMRKIESGKRTPIIALTAHSMTEHKTDLLISGMDDCIRKPVAQDQLAHMLTRWLGLNQNRITPEPRVIGLAPPPQAIDNSGPVNISQCLGLANQKADLAKDMLSMLIDNLHEEKKAINDAFRAQNWAVLQDLIHKLYGSSCYTGVPHLRGLSGLIDKTLQARQTDALAPMIRSLNTAIDQLTKWQKNTNIDKLFNAYAE
ncbi:response regulator [Gilvimarinus sp. DA14]|uniref:response regulator n=1 Tax=Gilvimarinus sp. DA14 TaxID=2956798 RepID=UPI0020B67B2A|nr:response regulator [Gilvimarinus sp. DA14]UTF61041.1 response regulator [Gilvimarinus sp. DA14]